MILWQIGGAGGHFEYLADAKAGGASQIRVCPAGRDLFVTAFRAREENLKVVAWKVV